MVFREVSSDELTLIEEWIYQFCEDVNLPTTKRRSKTNGTYINY